ncbi:MAG TPA: hypothetical protein EYP58_00580 [bacterium (Candidatus Stahlbacteria)]|nr:hypothetical protein [Candidatus Stahlbacteria bacterium]
MIVPLLFSQLDEDHIRMITSIKVAELSQILELNEHQIAEMIPKVRALEANRFRFQKQRRRLIKELKILIRSRSKREFLKDKVAEYKELKKEFEKQEERLNNEIERLLTLEQKVKFFIFQEEFENRLRKTIMTIKRRQMPFMHRE